MATTASIEASEIRRRGRRRLIGAIVLVVLAVVFIPMILDSEPRPKQNDVSLEIPAKDKVPPLPPPVVPAKAGTQETAPAVPKAEPVAPKAAAAAPQKPKVATAAPPKAKAEASTPKLEGFAVQVGAFKDETKLNQAREKLMAAKIPHFVERRGDLNRLRAGPFPTREAAEKALATVKSASLDGQIVALP